MFCSVCRTETIWRTTFRVRSVEMFVAGRRIAARRDDNTTERVENPREQARVTRRSTDGPCASARKTNIIIVSTTNVMACYYSPASSIDPNGRRRLVRAPRGCRRRGARVAFVRWGGGKNLSHSLFLSRKKKKNAK